MRVPSSLSSLSSSLSGISLLRNLGAQALERPREPRLDGSSRATQDRGHLLFGQPMAHRASSRRLPRASSNSSRRSAARTAASGEEGLFSGVPSRAVRRNRLARRAAALRWFLFSLATIASSQGLKRAPDRNRPRAR